MPPAPPLDSGPVSRHGACFRRSDDVQLPGRSILVPTAQCVTSSINATGTWDNPGRSWLFVPGNRDRMIAKAASVGADVVMFDLEDSVPPEEKANALGKVSRYLATQPTSSTRGDTKPAAFVRVNRSEGEGLAAQLGPLVRGGLVGVCIPKVESPIDVATVSDMLSEFEVRASLPAGSVWVQPIIETALGLLHAEQIAGCDTRVLALAFGAEDFALDMGIDRLDAVAELDQARWHVSVSARAAGVLAVDCVYPRIDDERGLIPGDHPGQTDGISGQTDNSSAPDRGGAFRICANAKGDRERSTHRRSLRSRSVGRERNYRARRSYDRRAGG